MKRYTSVLLGLVLSLGLLGAACGNDDDATPAPAPTEDGEPESQQTPAPAPTEDGEPESQQTPAPEPTQTTQPEIDTARLEEIVSGWMKDTGAPGVVLGFARGDEEPRTFAWGLSNVANNEELTVDHHVRMRGLTIPVTVSAFLQLVSEGLVDLDAPVAQYLGNDWAPGYEHATEVKVQDLLGHTSGFASMSSRDPSFYIEAAQNVDIELDQYFAPQEMLKWVANLGPRAELHTEFLHSLVNYHALGFIIEAVTDKKASEVLSARVFDPLGLEHSFLTPQEFPPDDDPLATGYVSGVQLAGVKALMSIISDNQDLDSHGMETLDSNGVEILDTTNMPQALFRSVTWTGGGLETTIAESVEIIRGIFTGNILNDEQLSLMTTPYPDESSYHSFGFDLLEIQDAPAFGHQSNPIGFYSLSLYMPSLDLAIAINANISLSDPERTLLSLVEELIQIITATE